MTNLDDIVIAHETHQKRLERVIESVGGNIEKVRLLHILVRNTLAYYGYDTQAQEFVEEHNRVFESLKGDLESAGEVLADLGNDMETIINCYIKELDELMENYYGNS